MISRRPFKAHTFATVHELAAWLMPLHNAATGRRTEIAELEQVLDWMLDQPTVRGLRD